jgi:hypothetical protein
MAEPSILEPLICDAIRRRMLMMFAYADAVRVVEPHLCGVNSAGNVVLSAWMIPGYSRSDPNGGWRTFMLERMWAAQILPQRFESARPGYNPSAMHMERVICALPDPAAGGIPGGESGTNPAT